ncbi:MAG: hypothetical protein Kow0029_25380 [Candidatus Rifleibacteriota bacterium]
MNCPECGANLHDPLLGYNNLKKSELVIFMFYTGKNPERLPPYGKVYINGNYMGNIPLIEKEIVTKDFSQVWSNGLGKDYTAFYQKNIKNVPSGILKVEIEMRFDRLYGFARSFKRVTFPYVSFKPGEETELKHYFNSAVTFNQFNPGPKKHLPVISEMKLQGASGTVALNVPLFY